MLGSLALIVALPLLPLYLCCFKIYFIRWENCNSCFLFVYLFLLSIWLVHLSPSLFFESLCILACEADLSAETQQVRREWGPIFNNLKEKNFQPRVSYPAKLIFTTEGKIKPFMNKQVLRDFITTRPALQELLKEALHIERNNQYYPS